MIVPIWRQHVCIVRVCAMPCLGAFQTCLSNSLSWGSDLSYFLIFATTTVGLWRGGQWHSVGCSGSQGGQQIFSCDDCGQQIQVSVSEAEQWCQRQTGCQHSEPPRFSHLHCNLGEVTYCYSVTMLHAQVNSWVPAFHFFPTLFSCHTLWQEKTLCYEMVHSQKKITPQGAILLICDHGSHMTT